MSPAKKFLLQLAVVSLVISIAVNILWGPPGMSGDYLSEFKVDHDRYVSIIKSIPYKKYDQRPALNGPGSDHWTDALASDVAFIEEYTAREGFIAEKHRIAIYYHVFEVFNALLVLILIVRFAKVPVLNFLDTNIRDLRDKLEKTAAARRAAETRKREAEDKLTRLPEEKAQLNQDTQERLSRACEELEQVNAHSLDVLQKELEDRKREEYHQAALLVKRELVNQTIDHLVEKYRQAPVAEKQADLVKQFTAAVEKRA